MMAILTLMAAAVARADAALPEIDHQRLFRLEYGGHASTLFVVGDSPVDPANVEVVAAIAALKNSCGVYLGATVNRDKTAAGERPLLLADHLSRPARETMRKIGLARLLNRAVPITTGSARRQIHEAFAVLRRRRADRYKADLTPGAELEKDFELHPDLHLTANVLFQKAFEDEDLIAHADEYHRDSDKGEIPRRVAFEDLAAELAGDSQINSTWLNIFTPPPPHDDADLETLLLHLGPLVDFEKGSEIYFNERVAQHLDAVLADRFFALSPTKLSVAHGSLAASGLMPYSWFPGERPLQKYELNVHETWVDPLLRAMSHDRVLIVVNARHVLPVADPARRQSLLQMLHARGVTITPISARRHKLHFVR